MSMKNVALVGYGAIPIGKYPDTLETELAVGVIRKVLDQTGITKE